MSEKERGNENLFLRAFIGSGKYEMPEVQPCTEVNTNSFISFNYAKTAKNPQEKGLHFFVDDYQFLRVWQKPTMYIDTLKKFDSVCGPDFSCYADYPKAMQIWNCYRNMWMMAYYQEYGVNIVPTAHWSDKDSFAFCFDGMPKNSILAVSSIGTQHGQASKQLFLDGYKEMIDRLEPKKILFYGTVPIEIKNDLIVPIGTSADRFINLHTTEKEEQ